MSMTRAMTLLKATIDLAACAMQRGNLQSAQVLMIAMSRLGFVLSIPRQAACRGGDAMCHCVCNRGGGVGNLGGHVDHGVANCVRRWLDHLGEHSGSITSNAP